VARKKQGKNAGKTVDVPKPSLTAAEIAFGPDEPQPPALEAETEELAKASGVIRYTLAEVRAHMQRVEEMMVNGALPRQIHRILQADASRPENRMITLHRVKVLCERVRQHWQDESTAAIPTKKEAAIRRIHQMRLWAVGQRDVNGNWTTKPNHQALARYEEQLMKLEGTAAPTAITVDGTFSLALQQATAALTGDQAAELLEEARETQRLADLARVALPALVARNGEIVPAATDTRVSG
jgi:hypothetical protein